MKKLTGYGRHVGTLACQFELNVSRNGTVVIANAHKHPPLSNLSFYTLIFNISLYC